MAETIPALATARSPPAMNVPQQNMQQQQDDAKLLVARMNRLEALAMQQNPFSKCCYNLKTCHGIAKAILMLYPNGRDASNPSPATIEKVRRFLKIKVKRHAVFVEQEEEVSSRLPSVELLLLPDLFSADLGLHSRLRIRGKEVLTPCVIPKLIWLAASAMNLETRNKRTSQEPQPQEPQEPQEPALVPKKDSQGRNLAYLCEADVPKIAHWMMISCVIPGGPWTIYGAITAGLPVGGSTTTTTAPAQPFRTMQAKLLQQENQEETKPKVIPFVNTPKNVAIVYDPAKTSL